MMPAQPTPARSLYEVLGIEKTANQADIRKAYHRLALQLHPDKNTDKEDATEKFQSLKQIYAVLSDPNRRKHYDQTGSLEDAEELGSQSFDELYAYYQDLYKPVCAEDIDLFANQYRGSSEEAAELLRYYQRFKGDMGQVFKWQLCSDPALDSHRFCEIIRQHCKNKTAQEHSSFRKWAQAVDKKPAPQDPLRLRRSNTSAATSNKAALVADIRGKAQKRQDAAFAALEAKYCIKPSPAKRQRKAVSTDETETEPERSQPAPGARRKSHR